MAKFINDIVMDIALDKVATANQILVCSSQPTTRANALSSSLASTTLAPGDFTKSDATPTGRKVTIAQKSSISVTTPGTANHIAIVDATTLLAVTTCPSQALVAGSTVTVMAWSYDLADPV